MSLEDFGKLWIASSDITANEKHIGTCFNYGADTVVLKTAIDNPSKGGLNKRKSYRQKTRIPGFYTKGFIAYSEGGDAKTLSIEKSNSIYQNMKSKFPDKHIIQSLGITCEEDFKLVDKLKGDAVELNLRYNKRWPSSPYPIMFALGLKTSDGARQVRELDNLKSQIHEMTGNFIESYNRNRPVILKLGDPIFETDPDKYLKLTFDGFTAFDSGLNVDYGLNDDCITFDVSKGKMCGGPLLQRSVSATMGLKSRFPGIYLSISGGIMKPLDADRILKLGGNSIQLCSVLYKDKLVVIKSFIDVVEKYK